MVSVCCAEGKWCAGVALGGLIAVFLLDGAASAATRQDRGHGSAPPQKAAQQPPPPAPPASAQAPEPYVYPYSCERPKSAEQDNLCIARQAAAAAKEQALWAYNTFLVGAFGIPFIVLTLAATAGAAWASKRSADAAVKQADIAKQTLSVSQRPWLFVEAGETDPMQIVSIVGFFLDFRLKVTNLGSSPALDVVSRFRFIPDNADIRAEQKALSSDVRASVERSGERFGPTVFPNEVAFINSQVGHNTGVPEPNTYRTQEFITGYAIGCIDYEFALGGRGQTRGCWIISQTTPSGLSFGKSGYGVPNVPGQAPNIKLVKSWPGSEAE